MTASAAGDRRRVDYAASVPFFAIHLATLLAFWTGVSWAAFVVVA